MKPDGRASNGGKREGAGRKASPLSGKRVNVYLPPDVEQWLRDQPDGMSGAIARIVRDRMSLDK